MAKAKDNPTAEEEVPGADAPEPATTETVQPEPSPLPIDTPPEAGKSPAAVDGKTCCFRLESPEGVVKEIEAETVEDAIREFNAQGENGKVFTFKKLKINKL